MEIQIKNGGPIISIPEKLKLLSEKYSNKITIQITLYNNCPESKLGPTSWFGSLGPMNDEEAKNWDKIQLEKHYKKNPNYYCSECSGECKITKLEKDKNFNNNFLSLAINIISSKRIDLMKNMEIYEEESCETSEVKYYWKPNVLETLDSLVELSGINKQRFIEKNYIHLFTTNESANFYETKKTTNYFKTGKYIYFLDQKYNDKLIDELDKFIEKLL